MLIRMGLNYVVHAAAGVATVGLVMVAAEGWRRAYKAGNGPSMMGGSRHDDGPDPDVARHDWVDEEATGGSSTGRRSPSGGPGGGASGA